MRRNRVPRHRELPFLPLFFKMVRGSPFFFLWLRCFFVLEPLKVHFPSLFRLIVFKRPFLLRLFSHFPFFFSSVCAGVDVVPSASGSGLPLKAYL